MGPTACMTRREHKFVAQAPLFGPAPACRSVLAHAPKKRIPRLIKSSPHFRASFLQKLLPQSPTCSTQHKHTQHKLKSTCSKYVFCSTTCVLALVHMLTALQTARTHTRSNAKIASYIMFNIVLHSHSHTDFRIPRLGEISRINEGSAQTTQGRTAKPCLVGYTA